MSFSFVVQGEKIVDELSLELCVAILDHVVKLSDSLLTEVLCGPCCYLVIVGNGVVNLINKVIS